MIVRILEARCIGGRSAVESAQKLLSKGDARHSVQLVEIVKRYNNVAITIIINYNSH